MPDRPITIIAPTIQRVIAGTCTRLRRPPGALSQCRPGDRLWIREQFRLPIGFDAFSPLQALDRGASPVMVADIEDLPGYATCDLGSMRFARSLPKAWHRAHLVIDTIETHPLQSITDDEITREGLPDRARYAQAWDANIKSFAANAWTPPDRAPRKPPPLWATNPDVLVLTFHCIETPLAGTRERIAA